MFLPEKQAWREDETEHDCRQIKNILEQDDVQNENVGMVVSKTSTFPNNYGTMVYTREKKMAVYNKHSFPGFSLAPNCQPEKI